jgi:non-ribosomal peptide synthase protein (TIGR01720 family)
MSRFTGRRRLLVDLEGHGREGLFAGLDLSRTVGWLTALHRVRLDLGGAHGTGQELLAIKEQGRAIPGGGVGYGVLRYLAGERASEGLREPRAEVLFNYLGRAEGAGAGGPWPPAAESSGPAVDPAGGRSHLLVVNCWVASGRLEMEWSYSRDLHRRATVERLADGFLGELAALVEHCLEPGAGAWSPSDFPDAGLGERELGNLLLKLGGSERGALR